jgi:asparaginyl-tRNA synthetase
LIDRMIALGMDMDSLHWYTDLRKYGSFPHGAYGLGLERLVCYLGGVENIRDAIGFPRWHQSCVC